MTRTQVVGEFLAHVDISASTQSAHHRWEAVFGLFNARATARASCTAAITEKVIERAAILGVRNSISLQR